MDATGIFLVKIVGTIGWIYFFYRVANVLERGIEKWNMVKKIKENIKTSSFNETRCSKNFEKYKKLSEEEKAAIEKEADDILEYTPENNAFGIKLKEDEK